MSRKILCKKFANINGKQYPFYFGDSSYLMEMFIFALNNGLIEEFCKVCNLTMASFGTMLAASYCFSEFQENLKQSVVKNYISTIGLGEKHYELLKNYISSHNGEKNKINSVILKTSCSYLHILSTECLEETEILSISEVKTQKEVKRIDGFWSAFLSCHISQLSLFYINTQT